MSKKKRIGIFMKLYRNEKTMYKAIESVLMQTYTNIKLYVLVNEFTKVVVEKYKNIDCRIEIIEGKSGEGFKDYAKYIAMKNDYVTVIDADDWYEQNYVQELLEFIQNYQLDIAACGNYFIDSLEKIVGVRRQLDMMWRREDLNEILPYIYAFFRTIWGKMMSADVILAYDINQLPEPEQYGWYGGDTLFMFNLLDTAGKVGITSKILYYYRISETSGSSTFQSGRLDSDEILFKFVKKLIKKTEGDNQNALNFLYLVYANAVMDTTFLILNQVEEEEEKVKNLLYVYEKKITKELLYRERMGILKNTENNQFSKRYFKLIFKETEYGEKNIEVLEKYLTLLEIICPNIKGLLNPNELGFLLQRQVWLNDLIEKDYSLLFNRLLNDFEKEDNVKRKICLILLKKFNLCVVLNPVLEFESFILQYKDIIEKVNRGEGKRAIELCKMCFIGMELPQWSQLLIELWINLAALLEDADAFIAGKQKKVEILLKLGKITEAKVESEDLKQMGIGEKEYSS